jgi:hypothetical protein
MPRAKGLPRSLPTSGHPRFCGLSWCARGPVGGSGRPAELVRRFAAWYENRPRRRAVPTVRRRAGLARHTSWAHSRPGAA